MSTAAGFAFVDGVVAVALMLSVPRKQQNRVAVLAVASVLLAISGWLAVLALDDQRTPEPPAIKGRVALAPTSWT